MADLRLLADKAIDLIKAASCDGSVSISSSKADEFNIESGEFTLYRTLFDQSTSVTVFKDSKKGFYNTNKITEDDVTTAVQSAVTAAESSQADPANVLAPFQGEFNVQQGALECDQDKLFARTKELKETIEKDFPLIKIMAIIVSHKTINVVQKNTNGTANYEKKGYYAITLELSGHEGDKTTGLVYSGIRTDKLDTPFIDRADFRQIINTAIKQLDAKPIEEKFTGTMVCTPGVLGQFLYSIVGMAAGSSILDKTSIYLDKLDKKIADDRITISFSVDDPRLVVPPILTGDGYKAETGDFIKDGVLKTFAIDDYISRKTGFPRAKNDCTGMIVKPGEKSFDELIKDIDKGILVGSFSGGQPGANGEFSGIAKSSFLIENGKVTQALSETMINGNFADMINNLHGISSDVIEDGSSVLPYMAFDGIVVSGK
ncbi:MAG: TldD/PmbA family protein [Lachnospiraceae bacterium]|nr:TldD/PmbA family protein [Lachnospiraceae bacterium]